MSEGHDRHGRLGADRLVYFSDAVVAIAITLLVLPLVDLVPEMTGRGEPVSELLGENLGSFAAFLLSFVVIARLWSAHHRLFDGVERIDPFVALVDQFWLLTIVVLPFPTALIGAASDDDPSTPRFYIGVLAASTVALTALALLMCFGRAEGPGVPTTAIVRGLGVTAGLMLLAFVVVLLLPHPSFAVLFILFVEPLVHALWSLVRRVRPAA